MGKDDGKVAKDKMKVCFLIPSYCFSPRQVVLRRDIAVKIKILNERLDNIAREKNLFNFSLSKGITESVRSMTTSFSDEPKIYGRDEDKNAVLKLLTESSQGSTIPIISIVGMGGIGKTTLARLAFNDNRVKNHFEIKIWVCVSDPFNEIRIAKAILESIRGAAPNLVELHNVLQNIHQSIQGKKFLLVLDDVWTEDPKDWEQLKGSLMCGSQNSRILVTTRKKNAANIIGSTKSISLGMLSEEDCWSLFKQVAFFGRNDEECEKLENIGRKILQKCKGLPLAVKALGSLLCFKRKFEQWQRVLDSELWELEEVERGLFPPLLLSYYDLPSKLRKCISYCAIFPKDYIINKDMLIKLWMAQGYLKVEGREDMELIGEEYFENLAIRSFFQNFERTEYDHSIISCKMHDIVHDFVQFLAKNECSTIVVDSHAESQLQFSDKKARHSMVICESEGSFHNSIYNETKLRSLVLVHKGDDVIDITLPRLFENLTCLKSLVLHCHSEHFCPSITELPGTIKKLMHLRYLKLSNNAEICELPEALCELYYLQILDVSNCGNLEKLPRGIGKLINLRQLINDRTALLYLPKGLERLTCLRTVSEFTVSDDEHVSKASTLECLKNLNHLQGFLMVRRLGNVKNVSEAKNAELWRKKKLVCLDLHFDKLNPVELVADQDNEVLEALQPSPNLEKLVICEYSGSCLFPSWFMSLTNFRELTLSLCSKCEQLPPLGRLPFLESLVLEALHGVKKVGNEFFGIESDASATVFPKLKYLKFSNMHEWEEWDYKALGGKYIQIMPHLRGLEFFKCFKLKKLPNHLLQTTKMNELAILWCSVLEQRYGLAGDRRYEIFHIPNVRIL